MRKSVWQLRQNDFGIAALCQADMVYLNVFTKRSAMPFDCGPHTGV
jgi:hypothetical protein